MHADRTNHPHRASLLPALGGRRSARRDASRPRSLAQSLSRVFPRTLALSICVAAGPSGAFASTSHGAALLAMAAPLSFEPSPARASVDDTLPSGTAIVRAAVERMGGRGWRTIASFESVATARAPMGDARVEYQFVAPDAHRVVQGLPGGAGAMEMGAAGGVAWIGEAGKPAQAADPRMAQELAGGGDLQTLVRSLEERFCDFRTVARTKLDPATGAESADGRLAWRIAMTPREAPAGTRPWELIVDAASGFVAGLEIPPPPESALRELPADAPRPTGQSIRFMRWEPVERGSHGAAGGGASVRLMAFREASVTAGGMRTELVYSKVAVDTLARDAIRVPETILPRTAAPAAPGGPRTRPSP